MGGFRGIADGGIGVVRKGWDALLEADIRVKDDRLKGYQFMDSTN